MDNKQAAESGVSCEPYKDQWAWERECAALLQGVNSTPAALLRCVCGGV